MKLILAHTHTNSTKHKRNKLVYRAQARFNLINENNNHNAKGNRPAEFPAESQFPKKGSPNGRLVGKAGDNSANKIRDAFKPSGSLLCDGCQGSHERWSKLLFRLRFNTEWA